MDKIRQWWDALNDTQKKYRILGLIIVGIIFIYIFILSPLLNSIDSLKEKLTYQMNLISWMEPRVNALQERGLMNPPKNMISKEVFLSTIDTKLRQETWTGTSFLLEQNTDGGVKITLYGVPFDNLIKWLLGLWQEQGVFVSKIDVQNIEKVDTKSPQLESPKKTLDLNTGLVNVSLVLKISG